MTSEIFRNYFERSFLPHVTGKGPILVIYDGHASHIDNILIEKARNENVNILKLPAHTSHLLQPLDLAVFRSFKAIWDKKLTSWQKKHQGYRLTKKDFALLLGATWTELDPEIIKNGFRKGGIFPFDRTVIPKEKYDINALKRWNLRNKQEAVLPGRNETSATDGEANLQINDTFENNLLEAVKTKRQSVVNLNNRSKPNAELLTANTQNLEMLNNENTEAHTNKEVEPEADVTENITKSDKTTAAPFHDVTGSKFDREDNFRNKENQLDETSFQKILLDSVTQSPLTATPKRKRVASGAEIVTAARNSTSKKPISSTSNVIAKVNKKKRQKSSKPSILEECSSESDDMSDKILYDESEDSFTAETLSDEEDLCVDKTNIRMNSWVLVSYTTKKVVKHFIGQVKAVLENQEFQIKFVRKFKNNFIWPQVDDTDVIKVDNIITSLPDPTLTRRGSFNFSINFAGYNI